MRFLGLDFGSKTIGIAISSPDNRIALGLMTLRRNNEEAIRKNLGEIKAIIRQYAITHIVLGLPIGMNGQHTAQTEKVLKFYEKLQRFFKNKKIMLQDERLSSVAVERVLHDKSKIDEMSAVYILQGFLDNQNRKGNEND